MVMSIPVTHDVRSLVRDARAADFPAIQALAVAATEEFREAMGNDMFRSYLANVLDIEARAAEATVLVAELGRIVVGTVTLYGDANDEGMPVHFPPGTAGVRAMAVSPTTRNRGIGSVLVEEVLTRARSSGARRIALHTVACMNAARRLYERHGFQRAPISDYIANDFFASSRERPLEALASIFELQPDKVRNQ
jgi:ribosomal protein S18 acetylase RimI-like enzyme